jgi:hypothetical protein
MRAATPCALAALVLACLLAARPKVTFDELAGRVEALERESDSLRARVAALEAARPEPPPPAGDIRVGMTEKQVESALRNLKKHVRDKTRSDTAAGVSEMWRVSYVGNGDVEAVHLRNGVVIRVDRYQGR